MRERIPLVTNNDMGKDQAAAEGHLRRLKTLEYDINKFSDEIERLRKEAEIMLVAKHFDSTNVSFISNFWVIVLLNLLFVLLLIFTVCFLLRFNASIVHVISCL